MAIFNVPLGMNVMDSPLKYSPFVQGDRLGEDSPPIGTFVISTEGGADILTEGGDDLTTE